MGYRAGRGQRWGTRALAVAAGAVAALHAGASRAQVPYAEGFALNAFEPSPAGDRFASVPDASSYPDRRARAGLVADYALGDAIRRTDASGRTVRIVSRDLYLHAGAAYAPTDVFHVHASLPFAVTRTTDVPGGPAGGVFGDLRLGLRANLLPAPPAGRDALALGPALDVWLPTGSERQLSGDGSPRVGAHLGVSGRVGVLAYAASVGYVVRKKIDTGTLETGDALTFGAAVGVALFRGVLQVGPELYGDHQVAPLWNDTRTTRLGGLLGARVRVGELVLGVAGGPGLSEAPGVSPRAVVSLQFAPRGRRARGAVAPERPPPAPATEPTREVVTRAEPALVLAPRPPERAIVAPAAPAAAPPAPSAPSVPPAPSAPSVPPAPSAPPTPESAPLPPPASAPASRGTDLTFAGFQQLADGASRLTLQFTGVPSVEGFVQGRDVEYVLAGVRIPSRNNQNPLIAQHFVTVVVSARLVPVKGATRVLVTTREPVSPEYHLETNPDGTATLAIDFPAPTPPSAAAPESAPAPATSGR